MKGKKQECEGKEQRLIGNQGRYCKKGQSGIHDKYKAKRGVPWSRLKSSWSMRQWRSAERSEHKDRALKWGSNSLRAEPSSSEGNAQCSKLIEYKSIRRTRAKGETGEQSARKTSDPTHLLSLH